MATATLCEQLIDAASPESQRTLLADVLPMMSAFQIDELVEALYQRNLTLCDAGQPERAHKSGQAVIAIGQLARNRSHEALGYMICGDAMNVQAVSNRACEYLTELARLFREDGNEFGWARTVIGRLLCAVETMNVPETLADAVPAQRIFEECGDYRRLGTLLLHVSNVYRALGQLDAAMQPLAQILALAEQHEGVTQRILAMAYNNLGVIHYDRGNVPEAIRAHQMALVNFRAIEHLRGQGACLNNLADIEYSAGHYRTALVRLDELLALLSSDAPDVRNFAIRAQIECYFYLNDFEQVQALGQAHLNSNPPLAELEQALTLTYMALMQAERGYLAESHLVLEGHVLPLYERLQLTPDAMRIRSYLAQIAYHRGDYLTALESASQVASFFENTGHQLDEHTARLLIARSLWRLSKLELAIDQCKLVLRFATKAEAPTLEYDARVVLGHLERDRGRLPQAEAAYQDAAKLIDTLQHDLTITLKPGFLGNKGDALRSLIALLLDQGRAADAFMALERSKSQVFSSYLASAESFRWTGHAAGGLVDTLNDLRTQYQHARQRSLDDSLDNDARTAIREQTVELKGKLLATTQQLYRQTGAGDIVTEFSLPTLRDIQAHLGPDSLLIAYDDDGDCIQAFTADSQTIEHHRLASSREVRAQIAELDKRAERAIAELGSLQLDDPNADPLAILGHPALNNPRLSASFNRAAAALYVSLIAPLTNRLSGHQRLVIIPYGMLHYLPFHLLYRAPGSAGEAGAHLIEDHEVVLMPTASLLTRPPVAAQPGTRILYDDWDGLLRHSERDAERIKGLLGGAAYRAASEGPTDLLGESAHQVLHIIAHGEFNRDNPELSYIQLGNTQIMIHDLLGYKIGAELVTLTACETGKLKLTEMTGKHSAGDDLIGLGRAFLYAGAGALLNSRWLIGDGLTLPFMERFYTALLDGVPKATAFRQAQCSLLALLPELHPILWGTFQIIGDPSPLSVTLPA